jgi:uncharacterized damage-inducible protein DinB
MRRSVFLLLAAATPALAQQQQATPAATGVGAAKMVWMAAHDYVVRSAEQMPESLYSFRPTPEVRSFGQLIAHVADGEHLFCSAALGEAMPQPMDAVEKSNPSKAQAIAALKASAAHCERAYGQSDADAGAVIQLFGRPSNRMFALSLNGAHSFEHYGNIVTYLRLNKMVPPSSQ